MIWMLPREYSTRLYMIAVLNNDRYDSLRLRLAMYKGLGFEPIVDRDGQMSKILVRECQQSML